MAVGGVVRVVVCGSRTFADRSIIETVLEGCHRKVILRDDWDGLTVIEGGADGADSIAEQWAWRRNGTVNRKRYPAEWELLGRSAGPIRNQQMLDSKPDLVLAFVDKPLAESRGTADMVRRARSAGVPVYVVESFPSDPRTPEETNP